MTTIKTVVRGRRVEAPVPDDIPDGTEVEITILAKRQELSDIVFMTEAEQGDDPAAIQHWLDKLHSLPPVPDELKAVCEPTEWDEQFKQFNLEAMRNLLKEGSP